MHAQPTSTSIILHFALQDIDYGDMAALAAACPQLQHVSLCHTKLIGPAFVPLQQLGSLHSLSLDGLHVDPGDKAAVLASLPSLTTLTRLQLRFPDPAWPVAGGEEEAEEDSGGLDFQDLLRWASGLGQLCELEVEDQPGFVSGMADVGPYLGGLGQLTCLQVRALAAREGSRCSSWFSITNAPRGRMGLSRSWAGFPWGHHRWWLKG